MATSNVSVIKGNILSQYAPGGHGVAGSFYAEWEAPYNATDHPNEFINYIGNLENYEIKWYYYSYTSNSKTTLVKFADKVETVNHDKNMVVQRSGFYSPPSNAVSILCIVTPVCKKKQGSDGKETTAWTAKWVAIPASGTLPVDTNMVPAKPGVPELSYNLNNSTLTITVNGLDAITNYAKVELYIEQRYFIQDEKTGDYISKSNNIVDYTGGPILEGTTGRVVISRPNVPKGSRISARACGYNGPTTNTALGKYGEYSDWSDSIATAPTTITEIKTPVPLGTDKIYLNWMPSSGIAQSNGYELQIVAEDIDIASSSTTTKPEAYFIDESKIYRTSSNKAQAILSDFSSVPGTDESTGYFWVRIHGISEDGYDGSFITRSYTKFALKSEPKPPSVWNEKSPVEFRISRESWTSTKNVDWSGTLNDKEKELTLHGKVRLLWIHNSENYGGQLGAQLDYRYKLDNDTSYSTWFSLRNTSGNGLDISKCINGLAFKTNKDEVDEDNTKWANTLTTCSFWFPKDFCINRTTIPDTTFPNHDVILDWRIRTKGPSGEWSAWSETRTVDILAKPTCTISRISGSVVNGYITLPSTLQLKVYAKNDREKPINYSIEIINNFPYYKSDVYGRSEYVPKGSVVYQNTFAPPATSGTDPAYEVPINLLEMPLITSSEYTAATNGLPCPTNLYTARFVVTTASGLVIKSDPNQQFNEYSFAIAESMSSLYIVLPETDGSIPGISNPSFDYNGNKSVRITFGGNIVDEDGSTELPISDFVYSVYRWEHNGTLTPIRENVQLPETIRKTVTIADQFASFGSCAYRISMYHPATGASSYVDIPPIDTRNPSVVVQWHERRANVDTGYIVDSSNPYTTVEDIYTDNPLYSETNFDASLGDEWETLSLPFNLDIGEDTSVNSAEVSYFGRQYPVMYYDNKKVSSLNISADIPKRDTERILQIRKLQNYSGNAYVREPGGTGYWATVKISFSTAHTNPAATVSLQATRVEED